MRRDPQQRLARLRDRYRQLGTEIAGLGYILKGSLVERYLPCGTPGCRCHAQPPRLHGPYWQWSTRVEGKTVSRRLSPAEARLYEEWIDNRRRLEKLLEQMYETSSQAAALLLAEEDAIETGDRSPGRRRSRKSASRG